MLKNKTVIYGRYRRIAHEGTVNNEPSLTKQSFKNDCDINQIMKRASQTGLVRGPLGTGMGRPIFGDFSNVDTYQDSLNKLIEAEETFASLPSTLRKRFDNDPAQLIKFMENEENKEEAIKLGLIAEKLPEEPQKVEIVNKKDDSKENPIPESGNGGNAEK